MFCFGGFQPSLLHSINPQRDEQIFILCTTSIKRELKVLTKQVLLVQSNYFTFVFKSLRNKDLTIDCINIIKHLEKLCASLRAHIKGQAWLG